MEKEEYPECYICKNDDCKESILKCECNLYFHKSCTIQWTAQLINLKQLENGCNKEHDLENLIYVCPQCEKNFKLTINGLFKILYSIINNIIINNKVYKIGKKYSFYINILIMLIIDYQKFIPSYIVYLVMFFHIIAVLIFKIITYRKDILTYLITKKSEYKSNINIG